MKSTKIFTSKIFDTNNNNKVYLCNCDTILEQGILSTLTSSPSDNYSHATNDHEEVECIGQTLFNQCKVLSLAVASYKRLRFGNVATLQIYEHGERIWLRDTSEGDAERGGKCFSEQ